MSKVIFGNCDVDNGLVVAETEDDDTKEVGLAFNCFGDGSHAFTVLSLDEAQALHIGLTRYLGLPGLVIAEEVQDDD